MSWKEWSENMTFKQRPKEVKEKWILGGRRLQVERIPRANVLGEGCA